MLAKLVTADLGAAFPYMSAQQVWIEHVPALALRISYAGELGWELYVATECGRYVYDRLLDYTPDEAGLGFTVHLTKPSFVGREAVLAERARGPRKRLVPIVLDDPNASPLGGEPILVDGKALGYVTSANFGYTVGASIAYCYLPAALAVQGQRASVRIFDREVGGVVSREPQFDPKGERLRA